MAYDFKLPDVGEGVHEAEVLKWMVDVGDGVLEDDPIAEVETERAIIEVPSPVDGRVEGFHAEEGETVEVGERLVTFERGGEGEEARNDGGVEILDSDGNAAVEVDADGGERGPVGGSQEDGPPMSEATRRLASEVGVDPDEVEGSGEDGRVLAQDILHAAKEEQQERKEERERAKQGEEETKETAEGQGAAVPGKGDKTPAMEDEETSPEFGQGETPAVEPDTAQDTTMFGDETPATEREEKTEGTSEGAMQETDATEDVTAEKEAVEGRGREASTDHVGPFEEEKRDEDTAEAEPSVEERGDVDSEATGPTESEKGETGDEKREEALMTHHDVADAERFIEVCEGIESSVGPGPTYSSLLVKSCAEALAGTDVFVEEPKANVGVAVEADDGVRVQVIENADGKGVAEISREINESDGVGDDETEPALTLVNVGATGGDGVSPVVGKPGAAAVSVGEIRQRPSVIDGELVARQTAPLHLTFDGRVVDVTEAARFTDELKHCLKEPASMLA